MTTKTLIIAAALLAGTAYAQTVDVKDAWVRTSVPGQKATGAFMKLTAKDGAKLVAASSPVAPGASAAASAAVASGAVAAAGAPCSRVHAGRTGGEPGAPIYEPSLARTSFRALAWVVSKFVSGFTC